MNLQDGLWVRSLLLPGAQDEIYTSNWEFRMADMYPQTQVVSCRLESRNVVDIMDMQLSAL